MKAVLCRQFASLTTYNYRIYFFGQMVSLIGTWMQTTGQAWLVLKLTGSADSLGLVVALQFLPITLFSLFGGVFADRLPKRRVLIVTQSIALCRRSPWVSSSPADRSNSGTFTSSPFSLAP